MEENKKDIKKEDENSINLGRTITEGIDNILAYARLGIGSYLIGKSFFSYSQSLDRIHILTEKYYANKDSITPETVNGLVELLRGSFPINNNNNVMDTFIAGSVGVVLFASGIYNLVDNYNNYHKIESPLKSDDNVNKDE